MPLTDWKKLWKYIAQAKKEGVRLPKPIEAKADSHPPTPPVSTTTTGVVALLPMMLGFGLFNNDLLWIFFEVARSSQRINFRLISIV